MVMLEGVGTSVLLLPLDICILFSFPIIRSIGDEEMCGRKKA